MAYKMDLPYFTEETKSLVALMKDFCEREVDRNLMNELADRPIPKNATREDHKARIPWDLISKMHDAGLRQIVVPKEYGGGGLGDEWITMHALAEAAGYYGGQVGRLFTICWKQMQTLCHAPKSVQDEFFPFFMKNRKAWIAATITEPDHGSDMLIPYDEPGYSGKVTAVKKGDDWVINGEKMWCTAGGCADYLIVMTRTDMKGPISESMTTFLVPTDAPGFSLGRVNDFMGNEVPANSQPLFDNVKIPDSLRISPVNKAFKGVKSRLAGKTIHYTTLLGESLKVWEDMKDYCKSRIQGGKPIYKHPNVGVQLAEAEVLLETVRLLVYQWAYECDKAEKEGAQNLVDPKGWWYVNYWYKEVVMRIVSIGLDVYGGMGPIKDLPFEHWIRVNLSLIHGGSSGSLNLLKAANEF